MGKPPYAIWVFGCEKPMLELTSVVPAMHEMKQVKGREDIQIATRCSTFIVYHETCLILMMGKTENFK